MRQYRLKRTGAAISGRADGIQDRRPDRAQPHLFLKGALLIRNKCEILIHINVPVPEEIPAYNRIRGFEDTCREHHVPYDLILRDLGYNYETTFQAIWQVFQTIEQTYPDKKKGVFLANDTLF